MELAERKCSACDGDMQLLSAIEVSALVKQLDGWGISDNKILHKTFTLKDFAEALRLANQIGTIAEKEGHHPDLLVSWGKLAVEIWTHAVGGLSENDFILAAKIDRLINHGSELTNKQ